MKALEGSKNLQCNFLRPYCDASKKFTYKFQSQVFHIVLLHLQVSFKCFQTLSLLSDVLLCLLDLLFMLLKHLPKRLYQRTLASPTTNIPRTNGRQLLVSRKQYSRTTRFTTYIHTVVHVCNISLHGYVCAERKSRSKGSTNSSMKCIF